MIVTSLPVGELLACSTPGKGSDDLCAYSPIVIGEVLPTHTVQYTPPLDANNGAASSFTSFQFRVRDADDDDSAVATVTISVTPVNDPPQAIPGQTEIHIDELTPATLELQGFDVDGDPINISIPKVTCLGKLFKFTPPDQVGTEIIEDGTQIDAEAVPNVLYVPTRNENGSEPFTRVTYRVDDGEYFALGTVDIFVTNVLTAPTANTTEVQGDEDELFPFQLQGEDLSLPNDVFTVTIVTLPGKGKLYQSDGVTEINDTNVEVTDPDGTVYYIGEQDGNGWPYTSFFYTVTGTHGTSQEQEVQIYLNPVPDDPIAFTDANDTITLEDTPLTFDLGGYDPDGDEIEAFVLPPDIITFGKLFQVLENGTIGPQITTISGEWVTHPNRTLYFEPAREYYGPVYVQYRLRDSTGRQSGWVWVMIEVLPVNDPPVTSDNDVYGLNHLTYNGFTLDYYDVEDGYYLEGEFVTLPQRGKLIRYIDMTEVTETNKTFYDGFFLYQPHIMFDWGMPYDNFTWRVKDFEDLWSETKFVNIYIEFVNTPPDPTVNSPSQVAGSEGEPIYFALNAVDEQNDAVEFTITKLPEHGKLGYLVFGTTYSDLVPEWMPVTLDPVPAGEDLLLRFTPDPGYYNDEENPDTIQYTLADVNQAAWQFTETVEFIVNPVNDVPTADINVTYVAASDLDLTYGFNIPGIFTVHIEDDALDTDEVTVTISSTNSEFLELTDTELTGVTVNNLGTTLVVTGTISALNDCFSKTIRFWPDWCPNFAYPCNGTVTVSVNDGGSYGTGGVKIGNYTTNVEIHVASWYPGELPPIFGAMSLVGVTTVVSVSLFAAYRVMKKKNLIPEEADPWENDDLFDATLDNPIYSGATVTMSAVYEDEE